jgi:hypothetical protein
MAAALNLDRVSVLHMKATECDAQDSTWLQQFIHLARQGRILRLDLLDLRLHVVDTVTQLINFGACARDKPTHADARDETQAQTQPVAQGRPFACSRLLLCVLR